MLAWIREKFGKAMVGGIISLITFVFVFYGVFSPKSTRGLHEGAVAGVVNGDSISISEYNRELNRRIEYFKNMAGGKLSDDQIKAFRIKESVFRELANRKMLAQEAKRQGLAAADDQVREKIKEFPVFQKEGKFDLVAYKETLEANHYSPGTFERMIGEDITVQQWQDYFRKRTRVSEEELKQEFLTRENKRNIKYVLISLDASHLPGAAKADLKAEASKSNAKDPKKDAPKDKAPDLQAIQKENEKLADEVLSKLTAGTSGDAALNALLKPYNAQVKTTGLIAQTSTVIPGVGEAKDLLNDAFAAKSPINPTDGKAKKYPLAGRVLVAIVSEEKKADLAALPAGRVTLLSELSAQKARTLFDTWMKQLTAQAKIETNPSVVGNSE